MKQSVFEPNGPEAERIAELALVLFGGATVVLLVVIMATWFAIRGGPAARRALASDRWIMIAGVGFPVVTLTTLLVYGIWVMRGSVVRASSDAEIRISVVAEQWWWRITYTDRDGREITEANELRLPVGRDVELVLTSPDVIHSFWVPAIGGKLDMIPGRTNRMRFVVDRPGVYRGQCAEYCGGPHAMMAFDVVVLDPDGFDAWLATANAAAAPDSDRGRQLFMASGCGACHAVRGTEAAGIVGPDLSRIGSRHTIGAGALPMARENLGRFVADPEAVKPGNLMPPFRLFSSEELDSLSGYLASLR